MGEGEAILSVVVEIQQEQLRGFIPQLRKQGPMRTARVGRPCICQVFRLSPEEL